MKTETPTTQRTVKRRPRKPSPTVPPARMVRPAAGPMVWSFDDLQPAGRIPQLGAANRHDPYYSTIYWPYPVEVSWPPFRHAAHLFPTRPRAYIEAATCEDALELILHADRRSSRHTGDVYATLLGAVHGWKTCTSQQIAALTGRQDLWSGATMPYATSIAAGLVDMGVTSLAEGRPKLLRPQQPWEAHDRLLQGLNLGQLLAVTGGGPWVTGPDTPRHNVLTTELALRAAEYCDIATVLTEEYSRLSALAGPPISETSWKINPRAAADCTLVRPDGLRIAIEVTATTSKNLEKKIESYAHLFSNGTPGLVVIFVLAPSIAPGAPPAARLRSRVTRLIERAVRKSPGSKFHPTAQHFGVIAWDEWFPGPGLVSERFLALTAVRPADVTDAPGWSPADFLDADSVPLGHLRAETAKGEGARLLIAELAKLRGSTPHWMRAPLSAHALLQLDQSVLNDDFPNLRLVGSVDADGSRGPELVSSRPSLPRRVHSS